jgi:acetyltransferase-like isoleucine patch superfamily enzyme
MTKVENFGKGNDAKIAPEFYGDGIVKFFGDNNKVSIAGACSAVTLNIELHDGSSLEIAENCALGELFVFAARGAKVSIGASTVFNGPVRLLAHEPGHLSIGQRCLFGRGVDVTISDMHSILDVKTGQRLNPAKDVRIEDDVWVGENVTILKGVQIRSYAVIGTRSVVTKEVPQHRVAVGNPARVLRKEVTWSRELL